jgi:hypothetical protein
MKRTSERGGIMDVNGRLVVGASDKLYALTGQ